MRRALPSLLCNVMMSSVCTVSFTSSPSSTESSTPETSSSSALSCHLLVLVHLREHDSKALLRRGQLFQYSYCFGEPTLECSSRRVSGSFLRRPLRGLAGWAAEAACSGSSQLHFMRGASSSLSARSDSCVSITYTNAHNPFHKPLHRAASSKDACTPAHIHFPVAVTWTHQPTVSIADTAVHRAQSKKFWKNFWCHTRVNTHTCTGSGFFVHPARAMRSTLRGRGADLGPDLCYNKVNMTRTRVKMSAPTPFVRLSPPTGPCSPADRSWFGTSLFRMIVPRNFKLGSPTVTPPPRASHGAGRPTAFA